MTPNQILHQLDDRNITARWDPDRHRIIIHPADRLPPNIRLDIAANRDNLESCLAFTCRVCRQPAHLYDTGGVAWCVTHAHHLCPVDPAVAAAIRHLAPLRPAIMETTP